MDSEVATLAYLFNFFSRLTSLSVKLKVFYQEIRRKRLIGRYTECISHLSSCDIDLFIFDACVFFTAIQSPGDDTEFCDAIIICHEY